MTELARPITAELKRLAETFSRETTLSVGWIAQELHAGVPPTLWKALTKRKKTGADTRD